MTITPTRNWQRAMERALKAALKATRLSDGKTYRVRSVSHPGTFHLVTTDAAGHITDCAGCPGWERYGRANPCQHAGAVAIALAYLMGASFAVTREAPAIESASSGKSQLFRTEVAA